MHLFHLDSSLREEGSVSRAVGRTFRQAWQSADPGGTVTYRDLAGPDQVPHLSWVVQAAAGTPEDLRTAEQRSALALSEKLGSELVEADAYLIASPIYNWSIPSTLKAWVDHLMLDSRLRGGNQPLAGRPAVLVMAKDGAYGPGTPKEGWDYAEPWLRRLFSDVMGLDLEVIAAELTLAGVVPALSHLQGIADESLAKAHEVAARHAGSLAGRVAA